ncbi:MAG: hypothetical protein IPO90_02280 [Flavobacteriales bacterium]|nr:hypothetical protein [Flavobacteriales bacterium]
MLISKSAGITALLSFLLWSSLSKAQSFTEGTNVLGVGLGVGGSYGVGFSGSGVSQSPAIALHFDHGMGELGPGVWGLGGFLGYKSYKYEFNNSFFSNSYTTSYKWTYVVVGARGTWHYNDWHENEKLDTYGGLMLAYRAASFKDETNYPAGTQVFSAGTYSGLSLTVLVGARYYFTDKIGVYGELGYGVSVAQLGLAVKL